MCLKLGFNVAPLSFIILACTRQKKVWKQKTINANGLLPLPSGILRSGITSNFRLKLQLGQTSSFPHRDPDRRCQFHTARNPQCALQEGD